MLRNEVVTRLRYLCEVGLGYLTLDRSTRTLSGGEVQRVNLTTCLGASLVNTLFVMDEPSVGLHPRDVGRLVRVMHDLRDKGNTLLVVEHEEAIIRSSDHVIDIGPGRGEHGGELVFSGALEDFGRAGAPPAGAGQWQAMRLPDTGARSHSLTADYLIGRKSIPSPEIAPQINRVDQNHRRARAQSQEPRRRDSARHFQLRHRRFRLRQIDADSRRPLPKPASGQRRRRPSRNPARANRSPARIASARS